MSSGSSSDLRPADPAGGGFDLDDLEFVPSGAFLDEDAGASGGANGAVAGAAAGAGKAAVSSANESSILRTVVPGLVDKHRYKITGEFARGGMGRILLAYDRSTGREVAIKELIGSQHEADPDPAGGKLGATGPTMMAGPSMVAGRNAAGASGKTESPPPDEITVERFLREAKITSRLEHPNIVPVYEIARRNDGVWYYTMKFVRGVTLSKKLREIHRNNQLDAKAKLAERLKLLGVFIDVCNAVAYAHSKGVVHRDLKPDNVMVGEFGETIVLDWGLAHVEGEDNKKVTQILSTKALKTSAQRKLEQNPTGTSSSSARLTMMGSVVGTPSYMPPEQAMGKLEEVDESSDIYALGAILYEILSGTRAYPGDDAYEILDAVLAGPPPSLPTVAPEIPPELVAVVSRAMSRPKAGRFAHAHDLGMELRAWRDGRAVASYKYSTGEQIRRIAKRHRAVVATISAALLILLIGGAFAIYSINAEKNEAEKHADEASRQAKEASEARKLSDDRLAEVNRLEAEKAGRYARLRQVRIEEFNAATKRANAEFPLDAQAKAAGDLLAVWEKAGRPEPTPAVREQNLAVSAGLLAAIEAHEAALDLARLPIDGQSPGVFSENPEIDAEVYGTRAAKLTEARLLAIGVARANGDFGLARHLLGWATKMGLDDAKASGELSEIDAAQGALLSKRKARIQFAMEDARAGLSREDREKEAPRLEDYAFELAGYRDQQTVEMLGEALLSMAIKAGYKVYGKGEPGVPEPVDGRGEAEDKSVPPPQVPMAISWTQPERDLITLCCRVLGRLELGEEAVEALTPFSEVVIDHELAVECGKALGATLKFEAWNPLVRLESRLGGGSGTGRALKDSFRRLPLTLEHLGPNPDIERLRTFGNAMYLKDDTETAIALFTRAIEMCDKDDKKQMAGLLSMRGMLRGIRREDGDSVAAMADLNRSIELDNTVSNTYNSRGLARTGLKDYQGAIEDYNRALDLFDEASANILTNRSGCKWALDDREGAMNDLADAIAADSQHATARARRAQFREIKKDYEGAIEDATRAIALEPHNHWALFTRGKAKIEQQNYTSAIEDLSLSLSLSARQPDAHYLRAIARASSKDLTGALADVEDGAKLDGNSNLAREYRARILERMGKIAEAQAELDAIIDSKPKELAAYHSLRGKFHARNKNAEQALLDANKAVDMEPDNVEFLTDRLEVFHDIDHEFDVVTECDRILKLDTNDLGAHNTLANYYKEQKEYDKAFEHYGRMLNVDPRNYAALHNRALLYVELGRLDEAIADFTRVIDTTPRLAETWSSRGGAWLRKKEYAKAIADYTRALELGEKQAKYRAARAGAYRDSGDREAAIKDVDQAILLESENALWWIFRAQLHRDIPNYPAAIADYTEAINRDDKVIDSFKDRGRCHGEMGNFDLAIADYTKAIALDEKDATSYYSRARAYVEKKDNANALRDYDLAILHDPKYVWAYNNRGTVKIDLGDLTGALEDFNTALDLDPKHASAYNNRAQVFVKLGDYKSAIAELDKVIDLEPEEDGWYHNRGKMHLDMGNFKEALKDFDQAVKLDPNAMNYSNRGVAHGKLEDNVNCRKDLEEAVRLDPESALNWNNLSIVCNLLEEFQRALDAANQAIKLDDKVAEYHYRRGCALSNLERYDDAIRSFDQAIFLDEKHAYAHNERGIARYNTGDRAGGIQDLERAVALEPSDPHHRDILYQLHGANGDLATAMKVVEAAIAHDNKVSLYYFLHGDALARLSRPADAIKSFNQAILLDPTHAKSYAERGRANNNTRNYSAAIRDLDQAEKLGRMDANLVYYRAFAKRGLGDAEGAIKDADAALGLAAPNHHASAFKLKLLALSDLGRQAEAVALYEPLIANDPKNANWYAERAELFMGMGQWANAIRDYDQVIDLARTSPVGWQGRGTAKVNAKDYEGAVADLSHAVEALKSKDVYSRANRSLALAALGDPKKALIDAKWCVEAQLLEFGNAQVARLEKIIALEPWLTKTPTTPEESILKFRAVLGFSHSVKGVEATKQAAALLESVIAAWKDVPFSDSRHRDVAELADDLGNRFNIVKDYPASYTWLMLAHERRQWLEDKSGSTYNAACSAGLEATRLAALEASPASPGTEPKKTAPADSPESSKYWIEKAFAALTASIDAGYANPAHANIDPDLTILRTDPRWKPLVERMKANAAKAAEPSGE